MKGRSVTQTDTQTELIASIEQAIADFGGNAGVFAKNLTTGEEVAYDPDPTRLSARFHAEHRRRFGHDEPGWPVEVVTLRLAAVGRSALPVPVRIQERAREAAEATVSSREGVSVVDRERVGPGATWAGPALVVEPYATTLVPPGWSARILDHGHLWIERA